MFPTDYGFVPESIGPEKVLCVPCDDPNWQHVAELDDVPDQLIEEIAHFFVAYKKRENHDVRVTGWASRKDAQTVIEEGRKLFQAGRRSGEPA